MPYPIQDVRKPARVLNMRFAGAGSAIAWSAENAVEALVVLGVHRARGYDFVDATDIRGEIVASDHHALRALAERECGRGQQQDPSA